MRKKDDKVLPVVLSKQPKMPSNNNTKKVKKLYVLVRLGLRFSGCCYCSCIVGGHFISSMIILYQICGLQIFSSTLSLPFHIVDHSLCYAKSSRCNIIYMSIYWLFPELSVLYLRSHC